MAWRFHRRGEAAEDPAHADAQEMVDRGGGPKYLEAMYDRLLASLPMRPRATVIPTHEGDEFRTYRDLLERLSQPGPNDRRS